MAFNRDLVVVDIDDQKKIKIEKKGEYNVIWITCIVFNSRLSFTTVVM